MVVAPVAGMSFSRTAAAPSAAVRFFLLFSQPASGELRLEVVAALLSRLRALGAAGGAAAADGAAAAAAAEASAAVLRSQDPVLLPAARLGGAQWAEVTFLELTMPPAHRDAVAAALFDSRLPDVHPAVVVVARPLGRPAATSLTLELEAPTSWDIATVTAALQRAGLTPLAVAHIIVPLTGLPHATRYTAVVRGDVRKLRDPAPGAVRATRQRMADQCSGLIVRSIAQRREGDRLYGDAWQLLQQLRTGSQPQQQRQQQQRQQSSQPQPQSQQAASQGAAAHGRRRSRGGDKGTRSRAASGARAPRAEDAIPTGEDDFPSLGAAAGTSAAAARRPAGDAAAAASRRAPPANPRRPAAHAAQGGSGAALSPRSPRAPSQHMATAGAGARQEARAAAGAPSDATPPARPPAAPVAEGAAPAGGGVVPASAAPSPARRSKGGGAPTAASHAAAFGPPAAASRSPSPDPLAALGAPEPQCEL